MAALLLCLAGLVTRMLLLARLEVQRARQGADLEVRIRHLRRAMAFYIPLNPWVRQAHDALLEQARRLEAQGEAGQALLAWGELRSAVLALRGLTWPYATTLQEANARIAALTAGASPKLARRLAAPPDPHPLWTLVALLGLVVWAGGAAWLLGRGLGPAAAVVSRRFWPLLGLSALGLFMFALGLALA